MSLIAEGFDDPWMAVALESDKVKTI
jgi:hypothetical protein